MTDQFDSVWDAIEDTTDQAHSMKLRAQLMRALQSAITEQALTQTAAARALQVTQPRIADLMRGRLTLFSLESLIDMAGRAGLVVELRIGRDGQ